MGKSRLNIPASLLTNPKTIAETYRAVYIRLLKLYTMHRKPGWDSYTGGAITTVKTVASKARGFFGTNSEKQPMYEAKGITSTNDIIIKEINSADSYVRYINLINLLNEEAKNAQESSNTTSLRTNIYFAIITLIQESIKLQVPRDYQAELAALRQSLQVQEQEYQKRYYSGLSTHESEKKINDILTQLVLPGDREIFHEAFRTGRNLFPYLCSISDDEASIYTSKLSEQFTLEERRSAKLQPNELLNPNIPYPLQRFFARILLMKDEFKINDMESFVKAALQDHTMKGTPSSQVKFYPPASTPTAQPHDIDDLREDSPQSNMVDVSLLGEDVELPNSNHAVMEPQNMHVHHTPEIPRAPLANTVPLLEEQALSDDEQDDLSEHAVQSTGSPRL